MKRTTILTIASIFSVLVVFIGIFITLNNKQKNSSNTNNDQPKVDYQNQINLNSNTQKSNTQNDSSIPDFEYVLKDFNGKVAVFRKDENVPEFIFDVYINNLPSNDQKQLSTGIFAKDDIELQQLIEDFSS